MDAIWSWSGFRAAVALGGFVSAAAVCHLVWRRMVSAVLAHTAWRIGDAASVALRRLVVLGLLLMGVYHGACALDASGVHPAATALLGRFLGIAWIVLGACTLLRLLNGVVEWRLRQAEEDPESFGPARYRLTLARKLGTLAVLVLAAVYVLRVAGADISPLLASGAIGGLALALAGQEMLSNLIAGVYLSVDRPVRVGDFIRLESGEEGYVEQIGWRNTTVRVFANNLVVIPNSKLSQEVLTNYYLPEPAMSVYVPCGVAYGSDLEYVEGVVLDVAAAIQAEVEGADADWEPVVRWKAFGDSAIEFVTVLRVRQFEAQYALQSAFVKALHARFGRAGIEIPFPMRTVVLRPDGSGEAGVRTPALAGTGVGGKGWTA